MSDEKSKEDVREEFRKKVREKETNDVTIYNVPDDVWSDFVSLAKLHYDNEGWRVLQDAVESLMEDKTTRIDRLEQRLDELEVQVGQAATMLQNMRKDEEDKDTPPKTFGEQD